MFMQFSSVDRVIAARGVTLILGRDTANYLGKCSYQSHAGAR